jgi:uncharacterized protein YggE
MTDPIDDDKFEDRLKGYLERFTTFPRPADSALDSSFLGMGRRRNRLAVIAAVAMVAVFVTGTATTALVVTLNRNSGSGTALGSTSASAAHSIFIPFAGQGNTGSGQGSSGSAAGAVPGLSAASPPQRGLSIPASSGSPNVFQGNYSCGDGASAQVANGHIQVQSIAVVGSGDQNTVQQLTIYVSGTGTTYKAAVTDAQAREVAVNSALQTAGIRSADITIEPVQIEQNGYYYYYNPTPSQSGPSAAGIVTVTSTDPVELGKASDAAQKAEGGHVTTAGSYGTQFSTPTNADIAKALSDAGTTAQAEASAAATATGLRLGKVSGLTASPPSLCYGPDGERLVVAVTVSYSAS